jgi:hypothetical protein
VEESVKEQAKLAFGYSAVPFYVVFGKVNIFSFQILVARHRPNESILQFL